MSGPAYSLRANALAIYGPTLVAGLGMGAVIPVLPLLARSLGASVAQAGVIAALMGVGLLLADLPAGELVTRLGERRALIGSMLAGAVLDVVAWQARSLWLLGVVVVGMGAVSAVFGLARMSYLTAAAPVAYRARAMSTLGGMLRVGRFLGPLAGAVVIGRYGVGAAFALSAVMYVVGAVLAWRTPDLEPTVVAPATMRGGVLSVIAAHRHTLLTIGLGAFAVAAARALRDVVLPLWGESIGMSAAQLSLVFGLAGGLEMLLFYPAGVVMDRWGREFTAVPSMVGLALGFLALPLTSSPVWFTVVAALVCMSNGLGSGILMTIGSDVSPVAQRSRFLAGWRLVIDLGGALGPLGLSAVTALAGLATAIVAGGVVTAVGTGWLWHWIRHTPSVPSGTARRSRGR